MADLTTLKTWLGEAEQARQNLITGSRVEAYLSVNGSNVRYAMSNLDELNQYIGELRDQVYRLENPSEPGPRSPLRWTF